MTTKMIAGFILSKEDLKQINTDDFCHLLGKNYLHRTVENEWFLGEILFKVKKEKMYDLPFHVDFSADFKETIDFLYDKINKSLSNCQLLILNI